MKADNSYAAFNNRLYAWYAIHKRQLPWRQTTDPYLIWISEIILQQTRVAQGYDYYLRFINRFPDVSTLAAAAEDEVLKYWQGLGYYSRARNLHAAARSMNGTFPTTYEGVLALKGVGEYTAAAICSIAYGMPHAVVDGNVYRVLARYFNIDTPIDSGRGKKIFRQLAQQLIPATQPALHNQAMMEFGALQCTPTSPQCDACPLADSCPAPAAGTVNRLPVKQHKTQTTNRYFNYIYVRAGEYTFIRKRTGNDIWKNLFELPLIETPTPVAAEALYALPAFKALLAPGEAPLLRPLLMNVKHVLSHRIIYANFYEMVLPEDTKSFADFLKIRQEKLDDYAISRLTHAFLERCE